MKKNTYRLSAIIKITALFIGFLFLLVPNTLSAADVTVISVATSSNHDFWAVHGPLGGLLLCLFLAVFPRFTLAFIAFVTGGIGISILGLILWILTPHLLVAIIATTLYWHTNPILVILAWFIAFGGETTEKVYIRRQF